MICAPLPDLASELVAIIKYCGDRRTARAQETSESVDVDRSVASKAGDIAAKLQKLGTPIGVNDCLIGGTALVHNLVLVSRNVRHFEKITDLVREVW